MERIGLCISGQTIKSAYRAIVYSTYKIFTSKVILNIGTFDLLNGRSIENMTADLFRLLTALQSKNLIPIFTTLAPLQGHLEEQEQKRQSFNEILRNNCPRLIDIEKCFISNNEQRILSECYQP